MILNFVFHLVNTPDTGITRGAPRFNRQINSYARAPFSRFFDCCTPLLFSGPKFFVFGVVRTMLSYFLTKYILYPLFHQKDRTLSALLTESDVPILVFANIDYSQAALPYNLRLSYTPEVIALPQTVAQVFTPSETGWLFMDLSRVDRYKPQSDVHKKLPRKLPRAAAAIAMRHLVLAGRTGA